jgi:Family of unknown function (DUF5985)
VAGLFFVRFWQATSDRLFLFFGLAFGVLAVHWGALAMANQAAAESRYYFHLPRLLAFLLIMVGIVDKNRGGV